MKMAGHPRPLVQDSESQRLSCNINHKRASTPSKPEKNYADACEGMIGGEETGRWEWGPMALE